MGLIGKIQKVFKPPCQFCRAADAPWSVAGVWLCTPCKSTYSPGRS